jgi:hypothetical protein
LTSTFSHIAVGILFGELILRLRINKSDQTKKRFLFWSFGALGGLIPDLDVIPAIIIGVHYYTFHHWITHTFLALGIFAAIWIGFRKKDWSLPLFVGFSMHLLFDFLDNSIAPLGPFFPSIEWGLLCGWGEIPGGSWASEFWLEPGYDYSHDLWSVFMKYGWGVPIGFEFLSYYDLALIGVFAVVFVIYIVLMVQKIINRNKSSKTDSQINNNL